MSPDPVLRGLRRGAAGRIAGHRLRAAREAKMPAAIICHGTNCRTLTGSALRTDIPAAAANFALRSGRDQQLCRDRELLATPGKQDHQPRARAAPARPFLRRKATLPS